MDGQEKALVAGAYWAAWGWAPLPTLHPRLSPPSQRRESRRPGLYSQGRLASAHPRALPASSSRGWPLTKKTQERKSAESGYLGKGSRDWPNEGSDSEK